MNYLVKHILYQIFRIILRVLTKKTWTVTDNSAIRIYVNKIESRITFRIKTGHYLDLLKPETLGITWKY